MKKNRAIKVFNNFLKLTIFLSVIVYLFSGIAKVIDPAHTVEAANVIARNLMGIEFSYGFLMLLIGILIIWEIGLSVYFFMRRNNNLAEWMFLGTNILFLGVAHYFAYLQAEGSCGCFGAFTASLDFVHMPYLYIFSILLVVNKSKNTILNKFYERIDSYKTLKGEYYEITTKNH